MMGSHWYVGLCVSHTIGQYTHSMKELGENHSGKPSFKGLLPKLQQ